MSQGSKQVLFFGNGINRVYNEDIEWGALLKSIAHTYGVEYDQEIAFTLEFERIVNQMYEKASIVIDDKDNYYHLLKREICNKLCEIDGEENPLYVAFLKLPFDCVLTTNYDYNLENAFCLLNKLKKEEYNRATKKETKYSLYRYREYLGTRFYHIHGEADYPHSLCLGYEHYANYLSKIMELKKTWFIEDKDKLMFDSKLFDESLHDDWVSYFFSHDIHIIGLGLSQNEMDIWWVLVYRAYLYYANIGGARDIIKNKVVYYDLNGDNKSKKLLSQMHVEVVDLSEGNKSFKDKYEHVCKII